MKDPTFKEIDFGRTARLLRSAVGAPCAVVFCHADGAVGWASEGRRGEEVAGALCSLLEDQADSSDPTPARRTALGDELLLCLPVVAGPSHRVGWLALCVDPSSSRADADALERTLEDACASLANEYRLNHELGGLVDELGRRHEELNLLYSLEDNAAALSQGEAGIRRFLASIADFLDVDLVALVLPERPAPIYVSDQQKPMPNLDLVLTELRSGVFRFVAAAKKPLIVNEASDPRRAYLFLNLPYRLLACPIPEGGVVAGMLTLVNHMDRPAFTNGDRKLARVTAHQVGLMLQSRRMVSEMSRFAEQMAAALIEAVEAKDPYTRGHSERVQSISVRLGQEGGLTASDVEDVSWGALLHDVGKIGIPDPILCKVGKLTEDEYTLVKIHPERSFDILRHVKHLSERTLAAARYHQEKFDGTGYPHGLSGAQIPVHARVIAVGDTYDAITTSRAYRPAQSHEWAMQEIRRVAGTQLDPRFVEIFERMCAEDVRWLERLAERRGRRHG